MFNVAGRFVEKQCEFYPSVKQIDKCIAEAVDYLARNRQLALSRKALPEETGDLTPEEVELNNKKIEIIRKQLAGQMSLEEAIAEQSKLTSWAQQ